MTNLEILFGGAWMAFLFIVLMLWSMVWKGLALWKASRNGDKAWYIALFLINTAGILEILYIYIWGKKKAKPTISKPEQM